MKSGQYLNLDTDDDVFVISDVEETFGIFITDEEAEATLTVGQLHDLIEAKCGSKSTEACYTQIAFNRIRRVLMHSGRGGINPTTSIEIVRCDKSIAQTWNNLSVESRLTLPPLETPIQDYLLSSLIRRLPVVFCFLAAIVFASYAKDVFDLSREVLFLTGLLLALSVTLLVEQILYVAFRDIPRRVKTIGDLAQESAGFSFSEFKATRGTASPSDRWYALTSLLRKICGYKAEIVRETRFYPAAAAKRQSI